MPIQLEMDDLIKSLSYLAKLHENADDILYENKIQNLLNKCSPMMKNSLLDTLFLPEFFNYFQIIFPYLLKNILYTNNLHYIPDSLVQRVLNYYDSRIFKTNNLFGLLFFPLSNQMYNLIINKYSKNFYINLCLIETNRLNYNQLIKIKNNFPNNKIIYSHYLTATETDEMECESFIKNINKYDLTICNILIKRNWSTNILWELEKIFNENFEIVTLIQKKENYNNSAICILKIIKED